MVLGSTRVVFTVQLIWFVALVPALYAGAQLAGMPGAAAAQVVVAAAIVLPLYLLELHRAGDQVALAGPRASPCRWPAGPCVAAVSLAATRLISLDLLALAVAGGAMLAALGLEARRMRATVRTLRAAHQHDGLAAEGERHAAALISWKR